MKKPARVDWSALIFELERAGLSQREIGARCDKDHTWVNRLKSEVHSEPKFHDGALLLGLWAVVTEREVSEAPTVA